MKRLLALAVVLSAFGLSATAFAATKADPCNCSTTHSATHQDHFVDLSWDR